MNNTLLYPAQENERRLSDSIDFYKFPMGQLAFEKNPEASVTFTMKNRGAEYPLSQYVDPIELQARLTAIRDQGFTPEEIAFFAGLETQLGNARFDEPYLDFLANLELTDVTVEDNPATGDFTIESTGPWANVSLWETVVMSEVNELYYKGLMKEKGITKEEVWAEGDRRLDEKIERLKNSDVQFADFGTRRRFSAEWQGHVVEKLAQQLPDNFIGTSNPWFAHKYGLKPIGTYAHEMPMVYAGLADERGDNPLTGHAEMLRNWYERYNEDLSIALTDTFTSDFFFSDFTKEQAEEWRGLRHDSGDPIAFAEQAIEFYQSKGIDPKTKTIIFSDGLDIDTILELNERFRGKVKVLFGWGTTLMNDMGFRANNIVMKATQVNGIPTVKLSDSIGKHTGPQEKVDQYIELADARKRVNALYEPVLA